MPNKRKCRWSKCGKEYVPSPFRFNQKTCDNYVCALGYVKEQNQKKEDREWQQKKKILKEKLKSVSDLEKEAKKVFQTWIRLRDQGKPCISCGCRLNKTNTHASHYFSAGQYSGYMFNENNVHSSCVQCNTFLHGNLLNYRKGLIERYGVVFVDELESTAHEKRNYKYSRQELIEIKTIYQNRLLTNKNQNQ